MLCAMFRSQVRAARIDHTRKAERLASKPPPSVPPARRATPFETLLEPPVATRPNPNLNPNRNSSPSLDADSHIIASTKRAMPTSLSAVDNNPKQPRVDLKGKVVSLSVSGGSCDRVNASTSSGGSGSRRGSGSGSVTLGSVPSSGDLSDEDIARAMLNVLKTAHAPLSVAQVALACKDAKPLAMWNFARWLQVLPATPSLCTCHTLPKGAI